MAQFCSVQDVETFLQIEVDETSATQAIEQATAIIQNYCAQTISYVEDDEVTLDVLGETQKIILPELPVVEIASVVEDDEELDEDEYTLGQYGILWRVGQNWTPGIGIVTVTYTHGYETIPDDIRAVCTRIAARIYQAGLQAKETAGVPGIASMSLGDYSISFQSPGASAGLLGASAAKTLLADEKELLWRYR